MKTSSAACGRFKKLAPLHENVKRKRRCTNLRHRYGIPADEFDKLLETQGNVCALCGRESVQEHFCLDHCHETGTVRGILCRRCNSALGSFGDTLESIQKVVRYLEKSLE